MEVIIPFNFSWASFEEYRNRRAEPLRSKSGIQPVFRRGYESFKDLPKISSIPCWNCGRNFTEEPVFSIVMEPRITIDGNWCTYSCGYDFASRFNGQYRQGISLHFLMRRDRPPKVIRIIPNVYDKLQRFGYGNMGDDEFRTLVMEADKNM